MCACLCVCTCILTYTCKQLSLNTEKISEQLIIGNSYVSDEQLNFDSVSSPLSSVYQDLETPTLSSQQQQAVETMSMNQHAKEELLYMKSELDIISNKIVFESNYILSNIQSHSILTHDRLCKGKIMYFYCQHYYIEKLWNSFKSNNFIGDHLHIDKVVHEQVYRELSHQCEMLQQPIIHGLDISGIIENEDTLQCFDHISNCSDDDDEVDDINEFINVQFSCPNVYITEGVV